MSRYKRVNRFMVNCAVKEFAAWLGAGSAVIDVGAGNGHYRRDFSGKRYVAVDIGFEAANLKGLDVGADITRLPFKDSVFDAAICIEVLEHVYERERLLGEMRRVLKKGGRLLLTSPLCFGVHMRPHDFFRYTDCGLKGVIEAGGFKVVSINPRGGYFISLAHNVMLLPEFLLRHVRPPWLRKNLKRLLAPVFTYLIPFFLFRLDRLDKRKDITLGYVCIAENAG